MALLINKKDFSDLQNSLGEMWQISQLAFQETAPPMVSGVWGTSYNSTTKLIEARNLIVNNSNYHNQSYSEAATMSITIGSTQLNINVPIDLYSGETVTSFSNTAYTYTIAQGGINTTRFFVTTQSPVGIVSDRFIVNNPYQTGYLDASITLENSIRSVEKSLTSVPNNTLSNVTSSLNAFYVTNTGMNLKNYFDPLRYNTGVGMTNSDWNMNFVHMWSSTRNEDLVLRSATFIGNGTTFISTDPVSLGLGINTNYTTSNGIRLKINSSSPTVIYNYVLAYTNGNILTRTLTTPITVSPGENVIQTLENGSAQFISLVSIGASNAEAGALMEVYNI